MVRTYSLAMGAVILAITVAMVLVRICGFLAHSLPLRGLP